MTPQEKVELMMSRILTDTTYRLLKNPEGAERVQPLNLWGPLIKCLSDEDLGVIRDSHIYLSVMLSPASHSVIKVDLPIYSKVITFDYNSLKKIEDEGERLAILLHEYGHAFNPQIKGDQGEYVADAFVVSHGYGTALRNSLERNIREHPEEFNQLINHQRVQRIPIQ